MSGERVRGDNMRRVRVGVAKEICESYCGPLITALVRRAERGDVMRRGYS